MIKCYPTGVTVESSVATAHMSTTVSKKEISLSRQGEGMGSELYEVDPPSDARWDAFIDGHPEASVFDSKPWLRALHRTYGYEPVVLTSCIDQKPLTDRVASCSGQKMVHGNAVVSLSFADHCRPWQTTNRTRKAAVTCLAG